MNFQFYVEKLKSSEKYKQFVKENKDAFPSSCFFSIGEGADKDSKERQHFDFYIPSKKEMISFALEDDFTILPMQIVEGKEILKISLNHDFDFNEIETIILKKMEKEGLKNKLQKMLLSLQNLNGKDFFTGTIFVSGLGLISITFDIEKRELIDFKKRSLFDMMSLFGKGKGKEAESEVKEDNIEKKK